MVLFDGTCKRCSERFNRQPAILSFPNFWNSATKLNSYLSPQFPSQCSWPVIFPMVFYFWVSFLKRGILLSEIWAKWFQPKEVLWCTLIQPIQTNNRSTGNSTLPPWGCVHTYLRFCRSYREVTVGQMTKQTT